MDLSRREFLTAMAAAGFYTPFATGRELEPTRNIQPGYSVLQGMTDENSAQFSIVLPKNKNWKFRVIGVFTNLQFMRELSSQIFTRDFSEFAVHKIFVDGLQLHQEYELQISTEKGEVVDRRIFKALDLSARSVRLALASCSVDHINREDVWYRVGEQRPDLFIFVGDSVYTDRVHLLYTRKPDPEQIWNRYVDTRNRVSFYFQKHLIPTLAIWDDHDYGGNNVGRSFRYRSETTQIFETFFAQDERPNLVPGPGVSRKFSAFNADFFLLDGRSFRDTSKRQDADFFGREQESWFFNNINPRATFILSGSVFYGAYTNKDSFEGQFQKSFERFVSGVKSSEALACLGSGDVHFSEVMKIESKQFGYESFELVSSSLHSGTFPGHQYRFRNERRLESTSSHNFVIFEGEFSDDRIFGSAASYSGGGQEYQIDVTARR